ncbi:hypothetical protein DEU38_103179 [Rhodococcus sp. AG1013]|uniref:hypothetical protein n=1 Tax=Rhodococcus sp. AG1013 TaxID=2183996 RepID=UPI000E0A1763|nr:hypothetical protein [Rhodococcus sp. AG1013]RDI32446.1 hypothetical protein DEU38_103179 [Rhodococcus sp. AG1013]
MPRNSSFYAKVRAADAEMEADASRIEEMVQAGLDSKIAWVDAEPYSDSRGAFAAVDVQTDDDVDIKKFTSELRSKVESAGFKTYSADEFYTLAS